jgi:hypothetical protein
VVSLKRVAALGADCTFFQAYFVSAVKSHRLNLILLAKILRKNSSRNLDGAKKVVISLVPPDAGLL